MKEIEKKMLSELVKNSRRSDRELAKSIGTSQPTATRIRTKLEKEGVIREYTAVPCFSKMGYSILALTFLKVDLKHSMTPEETTEFQKIHHAALENNPNAIMLVKRGMGLGYDAVIISLHSDYSHCDKFRNFLRQNMIERLTDIDTFLVNLDEEANSLPFSFQLLSTQLLALGNEKNAKKH